MGNLRFSLAALVLVPVIACGGDNNSPTPDAAKAVDAHKAIDSKLIDAAAPDASPDAQTFDFTCLGSVAPTTTTVQAIKVSGTADGVVGMSIQGVAGISVQLFNGSAAGQTVISGSDGSFAFTPVETGGSALDLTVKATGSGDRSDIVVPNAPLVANQSGVPVLMISDSNLALLAELAHATQDATHGAFVLQLTDCAGSPIAGATVTSTQGATPAGTVVDGSTTVLASNAMGAYFVFNVPAGATTINVTVEGHVFPTRTLTSVVDENTTTQILPSAP